MNTLASHHSCVDVDNAALESAQVGIWFEVKVFFFFSLFSLLKNLPYAHFAIEFWLSPMPCEAPRTADFRGGGLLRGLGIPMKSPDEQGEAGSSRLPVAFRIVARVFLDARRMSASAGFWR